MTPGSSPPIWKVTMTLTLLTGLGVELEQVRVALSVGL